VVHIWTHFTLSQRKTHKASLGGAIPSKVQPSFYLVTICLSIHPRTIWFFYFCTFSRRLYSHPVPVVGRCITFNLSGWMGQCFIYLFPYILQLCRVFNHHHHH